MRGVSKSGSSVSTQIAKRVDEFVCSIVMGLVQESLDSHFSLSDTVSFKPMNLRQTRCTIGQSDRSDSFQFSPVPSTILPSQQGQYADAAPSGNFFNLNNRADNDKIQYIISYPTLVSKCLTRKPIPIHQPIEATLPSRQTNFKNKEHKLQKMKKLRPTLCGLCDSSEAGVRS